MNIIREDAVNGFHQVFDYIFTHKLEKRNELRFIRFILCVN